MWGLLRLTPINCIAFVYIGDIAKADEVVLTAKKNITLSQFDTYKVGQELACLLDKASDLGLKPKVEEIRQELSQLHAHAMLGMVDYTETVSSIVKEHQYEMEKVKEWISRYAIPESINIPYCIERNFGRVQFSWIGKLEFNSQV